MRQSESSDEVTIPGLVDDLASAAGRGDLTAIRRLVPMLAMLAEGQQQTLAELREQVDRVRGAAFAQGQAHAAETSASRAQTWALYRELRAKYVSWLRAQPPEMFAPATFDEMLALYDKDSQPDFPEPELVAGGDACPAAVAGALAPCPFCAGPVHFCGTEKLRDDDHPHPCHHIVCPSCGSFDLANEADAPTLEGLQELVARKWNARSLPAGKVLVAENADPALLAFMAATLNHGFWLQDAALRKTGLEDMGKLYDEVVGNGYFTPAIRQRYAELLASANPSAVIAAAGQNGNTEENK